MSYFRLGDPDEDFARLDMEQARYEARLPKCDCCGEPIQDDYYWEIDGEILCQTCLNEQYRKFTDDYAQID